MSRRVAVTGMGAVTPLGLNAMDTWAAIKAGVCGVGRVTLFNTEGFRATLACEVKDFKPENFMERKDARRMDRFCQFAVVAADEAVRDSGISLENVDTTRFAVITGSGIGGFGTTEREAARLHASGPAKVAPLLVPMIITDNSAAQIALRHGLKGSCESVVTACASGTNAIGSAFRLIKHGYADACVAGGSEAAITPLSFAGFTQIQALCERGDPKRASIPFDAERDGFVMGEGAGMLVLEEYEMALRRGAKIYGEIAGFGSTCDAFHLTAPDPNGDGAARAMSEAIAEAGISPAQIRYINAHGTSTPPNDRTETMAIKTVFAEGARDIPISSTKSMTGHMLGATGAVEAIFCLLAMRDSFLPPTIGYEKPDPECDLNYIPNTGQNAQIPYCITNTMGFGGHNAALLLKRGQVT